MQLGKFLKVDRLTSIHSRGKFARICAELDMEKPLESHIFMFAGVSLIWSTRAFIPFVSDVEGLDIKRYLYGDATMSERFTRRSSGERSIEDGGCVGGGATRNKGGCAGEGAIRSVICLCVCVWCN